MDWKGKQIGFLGLGSMGFPIAYGLYKSGYSLILPAYRPLSPKGFSPLAPDAQTKTQLWDEMLSNGCQPAQSMGDLFHRSDLLMLSLPTSAQVETVILGEDGVLDQMRPGGTVVDLSSSDPESTRVLSTRLAERGIEMLDAPISGGTVGATNQTLSVMVGGKQEVFEQCRPIFDTIGAPEKIYYMGPSGAGDTVKCANNYLSSCCFTATTEALAVCAKAGIDPQLAARLISSSGGCSHATTFKYPNLIFQGKNMGMVLDLMLKDIRLFVAAAQQYRVPTFIADTLYQLWGIQSAEGNGNVDFKCFVEMYEKWCGIKLNGIAEQNEI